MMNIRSGVSFDRLFAGSMIFLVSISFLGISAPTAKAVAGDGATSNIDLLDTNHNGYIDRLTFDIANPNGETWTLEGVAPYGLSVTQGGSDITISGVSLTTAATANPVGVQVDLDENDADLDFDTDAVNSATPMELIYTQVGGGNTCTDCIHDGVDEELNAIATGDTGATDTEIDAAAPAIGQGTAAAEGPRYGDFDRDGKVDRIELWFSETAVAASNFSWNDFTFSDEGDFTGIGSIDAITDMITFDMSSIGINVYAEASVVDTYDDSGSLEITTQNNFRLEDAAGNVNTTFDSYSILVDHASPVVGTVSYEDTDNDGMVDGVSLLFSEVLNGSSSTLSASNLTVVDAGDFTGIDFGASTSDLVTTDTDTVVVPFAVESTVVDTFDDSGTFEIDDSGSVAFVYDLLEAYGNAVGVITTPTYADGAEAIITTFTPANGGNVVNTSNIVVTFSEPMDTTFDEATEFTVTPDPGSFVTSWTDGDTVLTINPDANFSAGTTYDVAFVAAEIVDASVGAALNVAGANDGTWSFSIISGGGGGGSSGPTVYTYEIDVLTPNGGEDLNPGETYDITWETSGTGRISFVDILFSADGGDTYTVLSDDESNDGAYAWIVPDYATNEALIRVESTDLVEVLATDISDAVFSIGGVAEAPEGQVLGETDSATNPGAGELGPSPVTGELEVIDAVIAGEYIRGNSFSTVYYVDEELIRHPFMDAQTFFTYEDSFDVVRFVSDATLPTLSLGVGMLPKPAVILVKIQSMPNVYAVEENPTNTFAPYLRHVETEEVAVEIYGENWADYVIDIPPFTYVWYELGDPIDSVTDISVDLEIMKTREALNQ